MDSITSPMDTALSKKKKVIQKAHENQGTTGGVKVDVNKETE